MRQKGGDHYDWDQNLDKSTVLHLKEQIAYQPGQVVSRTLAQNEALSVTLFSFDKGEEISTHESGGDAFVTGLDGVGRITIDGVNYELREGDSIVMPAAIRTRSLGGSSSRCSSSWSSEKQFLWPFKSRSVIANQ